RQPAAYYVVSLAEKVLDAQDLLYGESGGEQGVERKTSVSTELVDGEARVVQEEVPLEVQEAVCARDQYILRISATEDTGENRLRYATQAAEYFFAYGQFDEARRRFKPIYEEYCGKNEWGYNAWEKLITMAARQNDTRKSRALAESKRCSYDEESRIAEDALRSPVRMGVAYLEAGKLFEKAMGMEDSPERDKTWKQAAAAYRVALAAAPERDEAPEAAMNGAYAYKQVGEYDKAIGMYSLFIEKYGEEETLAELRGADGEQYEVRVKYLFQAYQALAEAYVLFFDYPHAAATFDSISQVSHFDAEARRAAAQQALSLYVNLGDAAGMSRARRNYAKLGASAEELAEADYLVASSALKAWDSKSPDSGANQQARKRAQVAMEFYYKQHLGKRAALKYVVRAAYNMAKLKLAAKSPAAPSWWKKTISAYDQYVAQETAARGSAEATLAAEADYTLYDEKLRKEFDYESGHQRFEGTVLEVNQDYAKAAGVAKKHYDALGSMVAKYNSQKYATVAIARQGALYDSLRTGLYSANPQLFTKQQERALEIAEMSDDDALMEQADNIRLTVGDAWNQARDANLNSADEIVVDRYTSAIMLAQRYNVSHPSITRALRRLAFLGEIAGEAKMSAYTANVQNFSYRPGMFQQMRPGVVPAAEVTGESSPAPQRLPGSPRPQLTRDKPASAGSTASSNAPGSGEEQGEAAE
ncbi:MAG: hypothetical protein MK135_16025, partial [Polyangiaceae bacterium]|nr:hypothetical protein [Polyangiaceae bacterium]